MSSKSRQTIDLERSVYAPKYRRLWRYQKSQGQLIPIFPAYWIKYVNCSTCGAEKNPFYRLNVDRVLVKLHKELCPSGLFQGLFNYTRGNNKRSSGESLHHGVQVLIMKE
ncbi:MAG: hypothetical protein Ct9H300mP28_22550 [Pseudomonadota bacterium]|nr:MAG: hypothetical protein Ct9H300mP28_22550 [Pseudomonadota bacterium]